MSQSPLATSLTLPCGAVLPNRIAKGAMTEGLADAHNRATAKHETLYRTWSRGGTGMLLTGNVQVDRHYLERPGNVAIDDNGGLQELEAYAAAGTENGNHLWMQISHAGRQTPKSVTEEPVGPSAIPLKMPGGMFGSPRALTEDEIESLVDRFANAVAVAKQTGFTGVQIHSAHGYLLSEFLSPIANQRTDQYGGSLENRARFLLNVIRKARAAVGPDFPIAVKLNSSDFQQGGFTHEECLQVVEWLAEEGIDLLEISGGNYEQPSMMGSDGALEPIYDTHVTERTKAREAYFLNYAKSIKQVCKVPLMVTGGFRTRAAMEAAITDGDADIVGIARPFCVMPDLTNKLLAGEIDEVPALEQVLRLGPGPLGPQSNLSLIKALNFGAVQAWFCQQITRMGDGLEPDPKMGVFRSFLKYQSSEGAAAKALVR